jgi:hypothetical protein
MQLEKPHITLKKINFPPNLQSVGGRARFNQIATQLRSGVLMGFVPMLKSFEYLNGSQR